MADRVGLTLATLFLVAALHGLGAADIVGDDEAREVGIVQDVVAGHWLLPRFNGEVLPDKPILSHWLGAGMVRVFGFSEWSVRLPSAVAGAALVWWTARLGAQMGGAPAGMAAALLLATTPTLLSRARVARPDTLLVLLLGIALGLAWRHWRTGERRAATLALATLGLATLAKGPVAPALFALTLGGFLLWQRDLRRVPGFLTPAGLAVLTVLGVGWYAVALAGWGEVFVREHLIGRYVYNLLGGLPEGATYSHRPLGYHLRFYLVHLPAMALPWTPVLVAALVWAAREGRLRDPAVRFVICWALAPVVAFTPAQWKLRHYLLPALPALALLAGPAVARIWTLRARPPRRPRQAVVVALVAAAGVPLLATMSRGMNVLSGSDRSTVEALVDVVPGGTATALALVGAGAGLVAAAILWRAWRTLLGATIVATACWMAFGAPAVAEGVARRDSLAAFGREIGRRFSPPTPLVFRGPAIRSVVVYAGRSIPTTGGPATLTRGTVVIARGDVYERLVGRGIVGPPLLEAEGRTGNVARARVVAARVTRTPGDPGLHEGP